MRHKVVVLLSIILGGSLAVGTTLAEMRRNRQSADWHESLIAAKPCTDYLVRLPNGHLDIGYAVCRMDTSDWSKVKPEDHLTIHHCLIVGGFVMGPIEVYW